MITCRKCNGFEWIPVRIQPLTADMHLNLAAADEFYVIMLLRKRKPEIQHLFVLHQSCPMSIRSTLEKTACSFST